MKPLHVTGRLVGGAALGLLLLGCAEVGYHRSGSLGMRPGPNGVGLIDPPIIGPVTEFLSARGFATVPNPGIGPTLLMERREGAHADRIALLESRHDNDPSGWITVEVVATSYDVSPQNQYKDVKPAPALRALADSVVRVLSPPDTTRR